jgi:hypothetical protein
MLLNSKSSSWRFDNWRRFISYLYKLQYIDFFSKLKIERHILKIYDINIRKVHNLPSTLYYRDIPVVIAILVRSRLVVVIYNISPVIVPWT